jgi:hypothetical protein
LEYFIRREKIIEKIKFSSFVAHFLVFVDKKEFFEGKGKTLKENSFKNQHILFF